MVSRGYEPGKTLVGVTFRSVAIGVICVVVLTWITPYNDYYVGGTYIAGNHFPIGACFVLLIFILFLNPFLKKSKLSQELSPPELITIWCMMIVASGIPSSGLLRYLLPDLIAPRYFATLENEWAELFHRYIPDWLAVKDANAVRDFYEQSDTVPWAAWINPMLFWIFLSLLFYCAMFCLCVILRKQWVENEKITFPLMQLPAEMVEKPGNDGYFNDFFKNKLMWIGCLVPIALHAINGMNIYFPALPRIPTSIPLNPYFTEKPWTPLGGIALSTYLSVIGISYLLTLEVSLSIWFFYLFSRAQMVVALGTGFSQSGWRLVNNQELGAYIAFMGFLLWIGRSHIKSIFLATFSRKHHLDDSREPLPHRWAVMGLFAATIGVVLMLITAGMSFAVALFVVLIFYAILTVITRVISDGGLLFITTLIVPSDYLVVAFGTQAVGPANHTILAFLEKSLMWDSREYLMPSIMNGFKVSDAGNLKRRQLTFPIFLAILVAICVGSYASLKLIYNRGALNLGGWTYMTSPLGPFKKIEGFLKYPKDTNWMDLSFILIGAAFMLFLCLMRVRFIWWGIHPIGYIAASKYHASCIWFSVFLGWFFKYLVLRYGGVRLYRNIRPLFLGLVVGECIMGGAFIVLGLITGKGYRFLPG